MTTLVLFGLSQFALLHFGHTRGRSGSRGNHLCPQRHRHPHTSTTPSASGVGSSGIITIPSAFLRIYQ
jgi:hypothetical protein